MRNWKVSRLMQALEDRILEGAPLTQNMSEPGDIDRLLASAITKGALPLEDIPNLTVVSGELSVAGGAVSAYGEWNSTHSAAKTAAVGAVDTGINLGSAWAGAYAGGLIGSAIGPEGTVAGAIIGAGVSLGVGFFSSYVGDNIANDIINSF